MNFRRSIRREEPEINFIPLIDLLLVILIFLMVTTTYNRYRELAVDLPSAAGKETPEAPVQIIVAVTADGQYRVDNEVVGHADANMLASVLGRAAGDRQNPIVVVHADAAASHQSVVNVMESARIAGRIGGGRPMAEDVDVEGPVGEGTGGFDHPTRVFGRAGTRAQTAQSPRVADGSRQFGCGHAGHGCLQDGQGKAQAFHQGMGVFVAHRCVSCAAGLLAVVVGFPVADAHRGWCLLPPNTPFTGYAFYRRM